MNDGNFYGNVNNFCLFFHNPYQRGQEGDDESQKIIDQLLYRYPFDIPDNQMEHIIGIIIALYTFSSLSLDGKTLDFVAWSNSKIAIRTLKMNDGSLLFLVLRANSIYSDISISTALDLIKDGLLFSLGPEKISSKVDLKLYFEEYGTKVLKYCMPPENPDPLPFSFTHLPTTEWNRSSEAATILLMLILQIDPTIWGCSCYRGNSIIISQSPLDLLRMYPFAKLIDNETTVYLSRENRKSLTDFSGSTADIPDKEVIEAKLINFREESISIFLITSPKISEKTKSEVVSLFKKAYQSINSWQDSPKSQMQRPNTLVYDSEISRIKNGSASEQFISDTIFAHDMFDANPHLRDVIMGNAKEFALCMNVLQVEHYASISSLQRLDYENLYEEALKANQELTRFIHQIQLSESNM